MTTDLVQLYSSQSTSYNTHRTHASARKMFHRWLDRHKRSRSDENLARYLAEIHHQSENSAKV